MCCVSSTRKGRVVDGGSWPSARLRVFICSPIKNPENDSQEDMEPGQLQEITVLQTLLDDFPQDTIIHAFAYGSGVFSQDENPKKEKDPTATGAGKKNSVVDLILVVSDALKFHAEQRKRYPSHYGVYSANFATYLQRHNDYLRSNPKLYFVLRNDNVKYGVVQYDDLVVDLRDWRYLYIAGRMHKPVLTLRTDARVRNNQEECNLPFALATALALTSSADKNTAEAEDSAVFMNIAALSYAGDPRTGWAEAPDKIHSLVHSDGQLERFRRLYEPAMLTFEAKGLLSMHQRRLEWDVDGIRRHCLPNTLRNVPPHALQSSLKSIVAPAARYQSIKGLWTVGPKRAIQYGFRKLSKGILRRGG